MFSKMFGCTLWALNPIPCWYDNKLFNLRLFVVLTIGICRCVGEEVLLQ